MANKNRIISLIKARVGKGTRYGLQRMLSQSRPDATYILYIRIEPIGLVLIAVANLDYIAPVKRHLIIRYSSELTTPTND